MISHVGTFSVHWPFVLVLVQMTQLQCDAFGRVTRPMIAVSGFGTFCLNYLLLILLGLGLGTGLGTGIVLEQEEDVIAMHEMSKLP